MKQTNLARLRPGTLALVMALGVAAPSAWALGFGTAHGAPQLGRPFYAEIPLYSAQDLELKCVEFRPVAGEEIYFPVGLIATIEGPAVARRMVVRSRMTVREPLVVFQVRAGCDAPFLREYSLLTEAPTAPVDDAAPDMPATSVTPPLAADQAPAATEPPARQQPAPTRARVPGRAAAKGAAKPVRRAAAVPEAHANTAGPMVQTPADRLAVGSATSQMRMLSDAIIRLEQGQAQRERIQGELVGAISGAVVGIVEVREQLRQQQEELTQLRLLLEREQRLRAEEARRQPDAYVLFAMILASGVVGAGLMLLHHTLRQRRRPAPVAFAAPADSASTFERADPVESEEHTDAPLVMPPARIVKGSPEEAVADASPPVPPDAGATSPSAAADAHAEPTPPGKRSSYGVGGATFSSLETTVDSAPVQSLAADIALPAAGSRRAAAEQSSSPVVIAFDLGELGRKPDAS